MNKGVGLMGQIMTCSFGLYNICWLFVPLLRTTTNYSKYTELLYAALNNPVTQFTDLRPQPNVPAVLYLRYSRTTVRTVDMTPKWPMCVLSVGLITALCWVDGQSETKITL